MKRKYQAVWGALFFLSFYLSMSFPLGAGTSTEQLRSTVDGVLAILNNPNLKSEARGKERHKLHLVDGGWKVYDVVVEKK